MYRSEHFNKIGNDVGSFIVGDSVPRLILTYYIVFLIFDILQDTKPFGAWRESGTVSRTIIFNGQSFLNSISPIILTLFWAYLFSKSRHSSLPGKLSLIVGYLIFALAIVTLINLSKFDPNTENDYLGPADKVVMFVREQLSNWYGEYPNCIIFGILLGMFVSAS